MDVVLLSLLVQFISLDPRSLTYHLYRFRAAVLAAGAPHMAPFMADEVLLALPEVDCLDYTMKEYMRMTEHVNTCVERLNAKEGGG